MHLFCALLLLQTACVSPATSAITEQLSRWVTVSSGSIPPGAKEMLSEASTLGDSKLASAIMKILGFGIEKQITPFEATPQRPMTPVTPRIGVKVSERAACPFGADPLLLSGEYAYCKPSLIGGCPVGFFCDQSFVLGRSICCQDLRNRPIIQTGGLPNLLQHSPAMSDSTEIGREQSRWTPFRIISSRRTPWYIKHSAMTTKTIEGTTAVSTTAEKPTTSSATRTTDHSRSLTSKGQLIPQARLWTTKSTLRNTVNVSVLQPGSVRSLSDVQYESVGAISLINDNGRLLLVDTGAASDMERLLQSRFDWPPDRLCDTRIHCCTNISRPGKSWSNPVVNVWLVTSVLLFVLHVICIFADWYGILRERPLWMIPKIVLKTVTVVLCLCATLLVAYLLWDDSNVVQFLVTPNTNLEYHASRSAIVIGGSVLIILFILFTALQVWLLLVLLDCFNLIQARHEQRLIDKCCNLAKESVTLDEIDTVVITHGHPGHMGNMNFFGRKPILFHTMEYVGRQVTPTELKDRPYRKLSTNVEVWKTPGHTQHDLSVLVHNVAGYGSMVIVGDLIPSEEFLAGKTDVMIDEGVWDSAIKRQNANLVICMADWVIPGHGQPFRVLPHYRQKAGCTRLAQQRLLRIH